MYSEYNLHISRNHSWQWILENAHYISCLFFYLYICIREWIWIYRRSILFVYVTTGRCFVINCTSLTVSHSPNFWRQEQPICYNVIHVIKDWEGGSRLLFLINNKILFFSFLFFSYFHGNFKWIFFILTSFN